MTTTMPRKLHLRSRWAGALGALVLSLGLFVPAQPVAATSPAINPPAASSGAVSARLVADLAGARDPWTRLAALSPGDRQAALQYLSVASIRTAASSVQRATRRASLAVAPGAGCWTWKWERDAYNLFGLKLWAYFQEIDWCDNGYALIGNPQVLNFGATYFPFWSWVHSADHVWGGAGQSSIRSWTQADFSLCLTPNIGCIQNTYPWLDMTARANGTASGSVG